MEEIIQIVIFVGAMVIAVVGQNAKSKKKPATASPQEVLEDMFPDIDYQQSEEEIPQAQPVRPVTVKRTSPKIRTAPVETRRTTPSPSPSPKQERKIRLNTREEARRAFIHSEIFNRKY